MKYKVDGWINSETMSKIYSRICPTFLVSTSSVGNIKKFITTLRTEHSTEVTNAGYIKLIGSEKDGRDCVYFANGFKEYIHSFTLIIGSVSVIMLLILILLVTNLISLSVTGRKKEIGILSALGTSNKDIAKIFIIETLIIAVITFVIVFIASFIFAAVFNQFYSDSYYKITVPMQFFNVQVLTVGTLAVASFGFLLLGAMIPLLKISRLKPIDAIRNV